MIRRNIFVVARDNNAGYLSHDPQTGSYKTNKFEDMNIESENGRASVAAISVISSEVLQYISNNIDKLASGMRVTLYTLIPVSINYYEICKIARANVADIYHPTEDESSFVAASFVAAVQSRLEDAGLEPLSAEAQSVYSIFAQLVVDTMGVVKVRKINDIRTMSGIQGKTFKTLESKAWDLVPMPKLTEEKSSVELNEEAPAEIPF